MEKIQLKASILAQLCDSSEELTRMTLARICTRCYRLAQALLVKADEISFANVHIAANDTAQCASHVLTVSATI
jgi:hypothetical protein